MGDEGTGAGVRGVSGGERKRVTVGVGLVTQPKVALETPSFQRRGPILMCMLMSCRAQREALGREADQG